jgi:type I restriction enzyme S subunit
MSLQTFFDNFVLLADAPSGIVKLRELILQLAVQGQLDTQNPNDASASALFRKIQLHKARLIKDKRIRNSKPLPAIQASEILFDIPKSWQWIRFGEIGDWGAGATPDRKNPKYYGGNIRWFKSGELNDGYIHESEEAITDLALKECSLRLNQPGDVLIAMYGATIGKLAILETEATTNQAVCACTCFDGFYNQFLFVLLRAYKSHFTGQGAGGAQPNISREKIIHTVAPLPPFEEQKRIVAKVDELMMLCDELEARQQAKRESHMRLNNATLAPLSNAASLAPEEFEQAAARLADNFAALYDSAETVGKLRSAILQLAVQGKLVPQDSRDEPASALIERIKKKKAQLIRKRIIKKENSPSPINNDELSYPLPTNWQWIRLEEISDVGTGSTPLTSNAEYYHQGTIAWVTSAATSQDYIYDADTRITQKAVTDYRLRLYPVGTLVIALYGQGKTRGQISQLRIEATINQACAAISLIENSEEHSYYVRRFFEKAYEELRALAAGGAQPNLNLRKIKETLIPLPPLEEQKRIVAKVNQLMALCDELEAKLRQTEADSEKLMKAAVRYVLDAINKASSKNSLSFVA